MADLDLAPVAPPGMAGQVPVIDLGSNGERLVEAIGAACRDWGFFQVVGHGVDPALIDAAMRETRGFFALPKAAKRAVERSRDNPWGFYDRELTKNARDRKEVFDIGPDDGVFAGTTPWPAEPAAFRPALTTYMSACETLSARLMALVSQSLGARADEAAALFRPDHTSFLRLNHYPVGDPLGDEATDEAGLGIHHHSDAGALTVLLQDRVSGLQVYSGGAWHLVEPVEGAFTINIGDMVQVWSNDCFRAPVHRVLAMDEAERFSLPYFYNPSYAADVRPLAGTGAARYHPVNWGEFRRRRADGDFADYGAEVQISDYRQPNVA